MGAKTKNSRHDHSRGRQWDEDSLFSSATSADVALYAEAELSSSSSERNMAAGRRSPGRTQQRSKPLPDFDLFEGKQGRRGRRVEPNPGPKARKGQSEPYTSARRAEHDSTTSSSSSLEDRSPHRAASSSSSSSSDRPRVHTGRQTSPKASPKAHKLEPSKQAYFSPTVKGLSPYHAGERGRPTFFPPQQDEFKEVRVTIRAEAALPEEIQEFESDVARGVMQEETQWDSPPREVRVTIRPEAALSHEVVEEVVARAEESDDPPIEEAKEVMVTIRPEAAQAFEIGEDERSASENEEADGIVPPEYVAIAQEEGYNPSRWEPLLKDEGFIANAFFSPRYGEESLEQVRVQLRVSKQEPVLGLKVLGTPKNSYRVLLLPDALTPPSKDKSALQYFTRFKWPRGPQQIAEAEASHPIVSYMRNMRDPLIFVFETESEQRRLFEVLEMCHTLAQKRHENWKVSERGRTYPPDSPLPRTMLVERSAKKWVKNYDAFYNKRETFLKKLGIVCRKLKCEHAVRRYLEAARINDLDQWVILRNPSSNRYEPRKVKVWIHHNSPFMMVTDHKGKTTKFGLGGQLDLLSLTACQTSVELNQGYPPEIGPKRQTPYMLPMESLDVAGRKTYFRFDSAERMKDFKQAICALSYLQQYDLE